MTDRRDHVRPLVPAASVAGSATRPRLAVFISYSRADSAFADELAAALEAFGGFEVLIDRDDIHEGEEWRGRLGALIAGSDTVVFVLSPKSATSPVCAWEVDEAIRLSKRILPVLAVQLGETAAPKALSDLNYIRFDPLEPGRPRSFVEGVVALRRALNTDIGWLREHTRLLLRAQEWEAASRPESRLLTGSDIAEAKAWLDRPPKEAPPPTELHREFIGASDKAQELRLSVERQNAQRLRRANALLKWAFSGMAVLAVGMGYAFYIARQKSIDLSNLEARNATDRFNQSRLQTKEPEKSGETGTVKRSQFVGELKLESQKDGRTFRVLQPFTFYDSSGRAWKVPAGFVSDGASIQPAMWSIVRPDDPKLTGPAVLHDYYTTTKQRSWEDTHKMFLEALLASGVSPSTAQSLYAALLFGGPRWSAPPAK